jgi:hypothetical protein
LSSEPIGYVDSGKTCAGWAVMKGKDLVDCGLWRFGEILYARNSVVRKVTVEMPVQRGRDSQVKVSSLIKVAIWGGWVAGKLFPNAEMITKEPSEWKGTIDADRMTERIKSKLRPHERALLGAVKCPDGLKHNVVDAIGMGLKGAYRL